MKAFKQYEDYSHVRHKPARFGTAEAQDCARNFLPDGYGVFTNRKYVEIIHFLYFKNSSLSRAFIVNILLVIFIVL